MSNYKRLFLEQYQYIFITIVTHNRNPILVENIETLKESIKNTHFKYNFDIVAILHHTILKQMIMSNLTELFQILEVKQFIILYAINACPLHLYGDAAQPFASL